ncbi:MAG TPA: hypothetical protein VK435_02860, partial [Thermodesulfovibrionales bacterium]|nr:hypothetical protein [Thermodesulfovibrionales bacterium]
EKKGSAVYSILKTLLFCPFRYDLLIPYLQNELIAAGILGIARRIPFIYFSLEIVDADRTKDLIGRVKKSLEISLNKRAVFTVVQDETRKDLIANLHNIDRDHIFKVPNSYVGSKPERSHYLRERFGIPDNKKVVLYAGAIEAWALDEQIIKAVEGWGDDFVLIMHGFSRDDYVQELKPLIKEVNLHGPKLILSLDVLNEEEYFNLVASADIGLVWYKKDLPDNVTNIGLSSGKLAAFLRCGLPVVIPSHLKGIREYAEGSGFGVAVSDESEIELALDMIANNYASYRENAFRFFSDYLDYENCFRAILAEIDSL